MPGKPRSEVFDPSVVGVYHCWNRLVRRRHLFGFDLLTGRDYSYRKIWVRERLQQLAGAMAIDVLDYAILERLNVDPRQWFDNLWDAFQGAPCFTPETPATGLG